jgi:hypothetical protein
MNGYHTNLFNKYKRRGVLLDTNILLVYFVGTFRREEITKFSRTRNFLEEDYDTLSSIIRFFDNKVFTTPNILTEVSNLSSHMDKGFKFEHFDFFSKGISFLTEEFTPSLSLSQMDKFYLFGLTDMAIAHIAREKCLVLTVDLRLVKYLEQIGIDVLNFNHIRTYFWE